MNSEIQSSRRNGVYCRTVECHSQNSDIKSSMYSKWGRSSNYHYLQPYRMWTIIGWLMKSALQGKMRKSNLVIATTLPTGKVKNHPTKERYSGTECTTTTFYFRANQDLLQEQDRWPNTPERTSKCLVYPLPAIPLVRKPNDF